MKAETNMCIPRPEINALPLWAQVLLGSRLMRRATLAMLADTPTSARARLLGACDAIDRCVVRGEGVQREKELLRKARDWQPTVHQHGLSQGIQQAIAAAESAEASLDFGTAELACERAVDRCIDAIVSDLVVVRERAVEQIVNDLGALVLSCNALRISRYDALPISIIESLPKPTPITLIEPETQHTE